jgi:predicted enzyme related to lactoylglutathione lyase
MSNQTNHHNIEHFEIPADNVDNLKNFYTSLFGWQFEKGQTQGYWMIKNAGISGAVMQKENPEQMSTQFVTVELIDNYIGRAQQLGAKVIKDKKEISEGYYAVLEDPQKNTFGIWQEK